MRKSLVYFICVLIAIFSVVMQEKGETTILKNKVSTNILLPVLESVDLGNLTRNSGYEYENKQVEVEHIQTPENQLETEFTFTEN